MLINKNKFINTFEGSKEKSRCKKENPLCCNIPWCKYCHLNPKILPLNERIRISKIMEHKFKKMKTCNNSRCLNLCHAFRKFSFRKNAFRKCISKKGI